MPCLSYYIHEFTSSDIAHQYHNSNGGWNKPPLKLGHGWPHPTVFGSDQIIANPNGRGGQLFRIRHITLVNGFVSNYHLPYHLIPWSRMNSYWIRVQCNLTWNLSKFALSVAFQTLKFFTTNNRIFMSRTTMHRASNTPVLGPVMTMLIIWHVALLTNTDPWLFISLYMVWIPTWNILRLFIPRGIVSPMNLQPWHWLYSLDGSFP